AGLRRPGLRRVVLARRLIPVGEVALVLVVGLEIRLVPAAALQAEDGRGDELLHGAPAAGRALLQRGIADLLHDLRVELAVRALVFVNRHRILPSNAVFQRFCFSKVMAPSRAAAIIRSPGPNAPRRICCASGFSMRCWMARLSGRTPYTGS